MKHPTRSVGSWQIMRARRAWRLAGLAAWCFLHMLTPSRRVLRTEGFMPPKILAVCGGALLLLTGGGHKKASGRQQPTPEAGYVVVAAQPANVEIELAGRTTAFETSEVRPQVSGVLQARRFTAPTAPGGRRRRPTGQTPRPPAPPPRPRPTATSRW